MLFNIRQFKRGIARILRLIWRILTEVLDTLDMPHVQYNRLRIKAKKLNWTHWTSIAGDSLSDAFLSLPNQNDFSFQMPGVSHRCNCLRRFHRISPDVKNSIAAPRPPGLRFFFRLFRGDAAKIVANYNIFFWKSVRPAQGPHSDIMRRPLAEYRAV